MDNDKTLENQIEAAQKVLERLVYNDLPKIKAQCKSRDGIAQCEALINRLYSEIGRIYIIHENK